jgi:hypothetical protein
MDPNLIPAVLTYIQEHDGFATKTKLLKLLYLLDIEEYRQRRKTLTGFHWIFYHYGPWTPEYDDALNELQRLDKITLKPSTRPDTDAVMVNAVEPVSLSVVLSNIKDELKAKRIIDAWATRPTGEILDYVYFHTRPMANAERGMSLDFETVVGEPSPLEATRPRRLTMDEKVRKRKARAVRDAIVSARQKAPSINLDPAPNYDSAFYQVLDILEKDPD